MVQRESGQPGLLRPRFVGSGMVVLPAVWRIHDDVRRNNKDCVIE